MKRAAKSLAYAVLLVLILLTTFIWRPEWLLTPNVLTKLTVRFGQSYHLRWKDYALAIHSRSFLLKRITLKTDGFCLRDSSGTLKGCFDAIDADVTVKLGLHPALAAVDELDVSQRYLVLDESKAPPAPPKKNKKGSATLLPAWLHGIRLGRIDVDLSSTTYQMTSTSSVSGDLAVTFSSAQSPPLSLSAQLYYETPDKGENLDARVGVDSDLFTRGALTTLRAIGRVKGDMEDSASFDATVRRKVDGATAFAAKARAINGTRRLRAGLDGTLTPDALKAVLTAALTDSSSTVREVAIKSCRVDAPLDKKRSLEALSVDCRLTAEPQRLSGQPGKPENKIAARLALELKVKPRPLAQDHFTADLTASVGPVAGWYRFNAKLDAKLAGRLHDLPRSLTSRHDLSADLSVPDFQGLVTYMKDTPYAIPAPLHVLTGPLGVTLRSKGDTSKPDQLFTYTARADLTSGRQKVKIGIDGKLLAKKLFTPGRAFDDTTEVALQQIALELPYLKLGAPPAFSVDSRIRTGEEAPSAAAASTSAGRGAPAVAASTASNVAYLAHVATVKPIILYTNLNPNPIPITLDLKARPAGQAGTITVEPFVAELFKRQARVQHVTVTMNPGAKEQGLDGLILVHTPDADVSIKLLGSTDKPRVVFESDPPMGQPDIVALLLFGQTPDNLDPDQKTTASNSQSALASGAFGLASLYLFASTPIQYVGYDPATQTYAMKFKLPGGASLEVGSGAQQQQSHLTLRKRLSRHWAIQTEYDRASPGATTTRGTQQNAVTTFLEWFQRY